MNWETAKTWLIAIFFVLDLVLGWQWIQSRDAMLGYVESTSDRLANTKTLLAEHGLALETDVPVENPAMASLYGTFPNVRLPDLAKIAFPSSPIVSSDPTSAMVTTKAGSVRILEPGTWTVTFTQPVRFPHNNMDALLNRVWHSAAYAEDPISNIDNQTVLLQRYNGYPLFDVPLNLQMQKNTMLSYTENAVADIGPVGANKSVISALDALDSLAVAMDKSSVTTDNKILKMDLGYLRKVATNPFGSPAAPSTYWFPVWRVVTTNQVYYINAFSGEVDI